MHNWNKLLQSLRIALRSLLRDFPSGINTASLRASMQVHAHMYHRFGLLPPSGMSFCSSLLPDSGGGQRSYGIKWLRAPETTENALYTLLFAKQPEATLRGTAPGIGSPVSLRSMLPESGHLPSPLKDIVLEAGVAVAPGTRTPAPRMERPRRHA